MSLGKLQIESFKKVSGDVEFWKEHILFILSHFQLTTSARRGFQNHKIIAGTGGTFPVFLVDDAFAIKFYPKILKGEELFEVEKTVYTLFQQKKINYFVPRMIVDGSLLQLYHTKTIPSSSLENTFDHHETKTESKMTWKWPFLVTTLLEGEKLSNIRSKLKYEEFLGLAHDLAKLLKNIQTLHLPSSPIPPSPSSSSFPPQFKSETFFDFLKHQFENRIQISHSRKPKLPDHLLQQIESYLPGEFCSLLKLFEKDSLVFLHADMHHDHIFMVSQYENKTCFQEVEQEEEKREKLIYRSKNKSFSWKLRGIIDMADCRIGYDLYEFISITISIFRGDKRLTRSFLEDLGKIKKQEEHGVRKEEKEEKLLVYKLMCLTLLHELNVFNTKNEGFLFDYEKILSLDDFANLLWNFNDPRTVPIILLGVNKHF